MYPVLYAAFVKQMVRSFRWNALLNTTTAKDMSEMLSMYVYIPFLSCADRYIFGCQYQSLLWQRRYRLDGGKSVHIYNGINEAYFNNRAVGAAPQELKRSLGIGENQVVIGTVGQLRSEKRHDLLLEAAAMLQTEFSSLRVLLVGDGQQREFLERRAHQLGIADKVIFLGEQADVRPALSLMDVFVLTSTSIETFSNAALEAMAMEKPVVLSDLSGAREMVENGVSGYITKCGDSAELATQLGDLLKHRSKRLDMGLKSRQRLVKEFTFEKMLAKYEQLQNSG
jgi:glycosyltransferase involved in cell wall biosynthesis